jgi:hypothetical protein
MTTYEQIYHQWAQENAPIVELLREYRTAAAESENSLNHLDVAHKVFPDPLEKKIERN